MGWPVGFQQLLVVLVEVPDEVLVEVVVRGHSGVEAAQVWASVHMASAEIVWEHMRQRLEHMGLVAEVLPGVAEQQPLARRLQPLVQVHIGCLAVQS